MSHYKSWQSGTAVFAALGLIAGAAAPMLMPAPAVAQMSSFPDVPAGYWAAPFIDALNQRGIIVGFPDGSYRPEQSVTRAEFAAIIRRALPNAPLERPSIRFRDVPTSFWAYEAIDFAQRIGFMAGYPDGTFRPQLQIPREQIITAINNGLKFVPSRPVEDVLSFYSDANAISTFARLSIAAGTERRLVVNYPNLNVLNPLRPATRAETAALVYQGLVALGRVPVINSPYIVGGVGQLVIPAGTQIPTRYENARIVVTPDERVPLTLTVPQNIVSRSGEILIPAGSQVVGELRPVSGGTQFYSSELVFPNGTRLPIDATSEVISRTTEVRRGGVYPILRGAAFGAAAAAAVAAVTGDRAIATEEVLGGAAIGSLIGIFTGRNSVNLIVIDTNSDLTLTLLSDLQIPR
ncbi:S-layer homology domain-containing protein [Trichothermofontia sichuanensis B231]|uniref:S-layer homology domain-containing protein n=1 Tax=Trichothermofontia sichuanensis TaxID=3045816 RepID=UPI002246B5C2|nr:S-layer homology domain-containing protein [Trichothermofontia sichuanensis]UZQ53925.1 S-layer homology domain-containing protein [Trichothermofontia sichuanensis B231]